MSPDIADPFSLPQILGYCATILGICGFLQKDDLRLRMFISAMSLFLITHFILMGSYSAALACSLAASRWWLTAFPWVRARGHIFAPIYVSGFAATAYFTYEVWYNILPCVASIGGTFALFYLHKLKMRLVLLFGGLLWCIHNILVMSYGPAIMEAFIIVSNVSMIIRMARENKRLSRAIEDNSVGRFG